jgi:hypothetical protein
MDVCADSASYPHFCFAAQQSAQHAGEERDRNDCGYRSRRECDERRQEPNPYGEISQLIHPVAWSMMSAVNGRPPLGVMLYERPQWPTITRAGAGSE